jgi:hypothetical protein
VACQSILRERYDGALKNVDGGLAKLFSRRIAATRIGTEPEIRRIAATEQERAALAAAFGLPEITELTGEFTLAASKRGVIEAELRLHASIVQHCVVSLEPFATTVREAVHLRFVPVALLEGAPDTELTLQGLEAPDEIPYSGEALELGSTLAEQLALELDPYPRKPGAVLPPLEPNGTANPFAILAGPRRSRTDGNA